MILSTYMISFIIYDTLGNPDSLRRSETIFLLDQYIMLLLFTTMVPITVFGTISFITSLNITLLYASGYA